VIILARHGETPDNAAPSRIQGHRDPSLSPRGREQARAMADDMAAMGIAALHTSHLRRARETADFVAARLGIEPALDPRLAEARMGEWEGRLKGDLQRERPEEWAAWRRGGASFRFPGGESLAELQERVLAALADVRAGPLPALVVCHGGCIRAAFAHASPRGLDAFHELSDVANAAVLTLPEPAGIA